MYNFEFHSPLWFLLLIPWLWLTLPAFRHPRAILFSDTASLSSIPVTFIQRVKHFMPWLLVISGVLVITSLARPRQGEEEFRIKTEGIAIEMVVDRSGSMRAMDFSLNGKRVNRLDAVKDVFKRFVLGDSSLTGRKDDSIGFISFGGYAEDRCPLTLDHQALVSIVNEVNIADFIVDSHGRPVDKEFNAEQQQTAIGDALAVGVERLRQAEVASKVMIFLSDGEQTSGVLTPEQGAELAKKYGVKVYTIGIGSTGLAPIPTVNFAGQSVLVNGEVHLDEETLKQIAQTTGGQYFNAKSTDALAKVYQTIDQLEKTEIEGAIYTQYRELYSPFLLAGLAMLLVYFVLINTRFRSLP